MHLGERRDHRPGAPPVGGTGGCSSLSAVNGAGPGTGAAAATGRGAAAGRSRPAAPGAGAGCGAFAAALPSGCHRRHRLRRGAPASSSATAPGPNPVFVTASADAGGFGPSRSTGTPAAFAALQALLHGVDHRLVPADLPQRGVDVGDRLLTGRAQLPGHQRADRRVPGAPLQRQQGVRTRYGAPAAAPPLAVGQSTTGSLGPAVSGV